MIQREHLLSRHIKEFVRDCVDAPHEFFVFDSAKAGGQWTHMRDKARGIRKGTPDTLLVVSAFPNIWCELKAPGNKPDDDQIEMGKLLLNLGDYWSVAWTVSNYYDWLRSIGVSMRSNSAFLAQHHDAQIASTIARAELKAGKIPKRTRAKSPVAASKIRKAHASGLWRP